MATSKTSIAQLYADVVADLIPYYDNAVLLPNSQLMVHIYNIAGAVGNTMRIPLVNSFADAVSLNENTSIFSNTGNVDLAPTAANITVSKRASGTYVTEEALEDGGYDTVRNAVLQRLSRSLAQATDKAGFNVMFTGAETALTDINAISGIQNVGYAAGDLTGADLSIVFSPEFMAMASKRDPEIKMFNSVDFDRYEMAATVRNGFVRLRSSATPGAQSFGYAIAASNLTSAANTISCSLNLISTAVANLRASNAPTDAAGFYNAVVTPVHEFHLAKELNGVGGLGTGAIGALSDLGNQALLDGLIGQAVGARFFRSNNLPKNLTTA